MSEAQRCDGIGRNSRNVDTQNLIETKEICAYTYNSN